VNLSTAHGSASPAPPGDRFPRGAGERQADGERDLAGCVDDRLADRFDRLAELIGGSPHNLVSRGERDRVRSVHIEESRAVGEVLAPVPGASWVDLGTGGGLPGLVLALCYPSTTWTLIDGTAKKVAAVAMFAAALELENVRAVHGRAEELAWSPQHRGVHDGVVSRAVAALSVLLELSRGFLHDGGTLAALKGARLEEEMAAAETARLSLALGPFHRRQLSTGDRPTAVVTMCAQGPPPRRYPRRTGVPAATPLGGAGR